METYAVIAKVFPIFLLFLLGYVFRRTGFLSASTASEMKKLVANIALPALLLRAFMSMEPGLDEVLLALMMFALCTVLMVGSFALFRLFRRRGDIRASMVSGFEAGMLGYALFLSVFGSEALPVFATVDLGQVLFVFIVLMPMLLARARSTEEGLSASGILRSVLMNVVKSPVVWSIVGGLILGAVSRAFQIPPKPFAPLSGFLEIVGNLTAPLIALAIGYELEFRKDLLGKAALFVIVRKAVLIGAALLLARFLPVKNPLIPMAFLTMLLLPPPYVVTLAARENEQPLVSGILSFSTVVSIPAFALALVLGGL